MSTMSEGELIRAVHEFLDQYYEDDLSGSRPSWPSELERLTAWVAPEDRP
jgi:hypothetical protein